MIHKTDKELCLQFGFKTSQIRSGYVYKNLWWSFDYDRTSFGYGDLNQGDLHNIYKWLSKPENQTKVFTGWNEHHGSDWQQTDVPMVRISYAAGVTRPHMAAMEARVGFSEVG